LGLGIPFHTPLRHGLVVVVVVVGFLAFGLFNHFLFRSGSFLSEVTVGVVSLVSFLFSLI